MHLQTGGRGIIHRHAARGGGTNIASGVIGLGRQTIGAVGHRRRIPCYAVGRCVVSGY